MQTLEQHQIKKNKSKTGKQAERKSSPSSTHPKNKWCSFHKVKTHDTSECKAKENAKRQQRKTSEQTNVIINHEEHEIMTIQKFSKKPTPKPER
jgi:hypothetical protein